jgi:hypothetical protein
MQNYSTSAKRSREFARRGTQGLQQRKDTKHPNNKRRQALHRRTQPLQNCQSHLNTNNQQLQRSFRKPVRLTITIAHSIHVALVERSNLEGRSRSNLAAHLLEKALETPRS